MESKMVIRDLLKHPCRWMEGTGPLSDIVLTSRVRLARNIVGVPFPHRMDKKQVVKVLSQVKDAMSRLLTRSGDEIVFISLMELSPLEKQILVEKHLISPQHAEGEDGAVSLSRDGSLAVMVNEEDHLRIQGLLPALQLHEAWRMANALDDELEELLDFAFDEQKGYLTACPTNLGTALRASVMLHLPALIHLKQFRRMVAALSQVGLVVRGLYGEGSDAAGSMFQISNQITLGQSEEEILRKLVGVVRQIAEHEGKAREIMMQERREQIEDKVFRAYGTMANARIMTSQEALELLSDIRLGVGLGIIKEPGPGLLNEIMVSIQPASLQFDSEKELSATERDKLRATVIRGFMKNNG